MLELLPGLFLAVLAVLGSGFLLGQWEETGGVDLFMWAGLRGLVGIAVLATVGGLLNIFLPLGEVAPWVMFPLAGLGLWVFMKKSPGTLRPVLLGLTLVAASLAARSPMHGDTGLYHQQAVIWMSESALPYGLANLHGRFGFNSAWWNFAALLQMPWMARGASMYLATPVLAVFFGLLFVGALRRAWTSGLNVAIVMILAAGYLWFRQMSGANNPSLSTDAPVNLFIVASAVALVAWRSERAPKMLLVWSLLACAAGAFKLTGLPWLVASAAVVAWSLGVPSSACRRTRASRPELFAVMAGFVILAVNFARGIVVSGYPFYPLKLFGFGGLPWSVRPETIGGDTEGIRNWPTRGEALNWVEFIRNWIENQYGLTNVVMALVLALAIVGLLLIARRRNVASARSPLADNLPVVLAGAAGLTVCFVYAPALRFVSGYFFVLVGLLLGSGLGAMPPAGDGRRGRLAAVLAVLFAVLPNAGGMTGRPVAWWHVPPVPEPAGALPIQRTFAGEPIKVGYAWDAEPPATPYFDPHLVIERDPHGAIRSFRIPPTAAVPR